MTMSCLEFEEYLTLRYESHAFDGRRFFTTGTISRRIEVGEWAEEVLFTSSPSTTILVCCHFARNRFTEDISIADFIQKAQEFPPETFLMSEDVAMLLKDDLAIDPREDDQIAPRFLDRTGIWNLLPVVVAKGRTIVGAGYNSDDNRWKLSRRLMKSYAGVGSAMIRKGDCFVSLVEKTTNSL